MMYAIVPLVVGIGVLVGYTLGRLHERQAQTERAERTARIDPGTRSPGLPTNRSAEPSVVRRARIRR